MVGIRDQELSEKLQLDSELTVEKAKKAIRQKEAVKEQRKQLQGDGPEVHPSLEEVRYNRWPRNREVRPQNKPPGGAYGKPTCTRCGKARHYRDERCPAIEATCNRCNKRGHYSSQCFTPTARGTPTPSANEVCMDSAFLDTLGSSNEKFWTSMVTLQDQEVQFKLDTGAEVTAISEETYKKLATKSSLKKPTKDLFGPTHQALDLVGEFTSLETSKTTFWGYLLSLVYSW